MPPHNDHSETPPADAASSAAPAPAISAASAGDSKPTPTAQPGGLLGTTLDGRYYIEKELGHGGVGTVYLARDRKLHDKPVVVKVLLQTSLQDPWVVQKFQQEKEALARVDHPGVVCILDTGELPDEKPYIVMQYIEGISLREAIKAQPEGLDLERAALIIKQAGAALTAVHGNKIYHRDLKPENIMLQKLARADEQVKIVDFGIAKVKESIIAASTVTGAATAGTIMYMSPEQLHGERITAASDIYAFGVIAYEMVTGRRPFNPITIAHLSDMQREGVRVKPADLRPRLPEEAQATILKALAFEPAGRYQSADEFGEALSRALMCEEETQSHHTNERPNLPPTQLSVESPPLQVDRAGIASETLATPFLAAQVYGQRQPVPRESQTRKSRWPMLAGAFVIVLVLLIGGFVVIAKREALFGSGAKPGSGAPAADQRSLAYSLTVQKMRDNKPYQAPFDSSGQEVFENGYKFRLNVSSAQSGYLYVFNEGAAEQNGTSFTIIYPTPATNKGSAKLDADQKMQTNWNTFEGQAGTEQFWIVWSGSPVTELETARDAAFKSEGEIADAGMVRVVREFLTKHSEPKPETKKDTMKQQTDVRASGELLVKLVELEHR